jgi:hypothetical protein
VEESYELFGLHDYFVVIREIEPCRPAAEEKCWRIVAQYWPSRMRPEVFIGTEDQLARDLAVLVLRGAVQNQGDVWRRTAAAREGAAPPFLMAAATPTSMTALEATARGLQILTLGREHPQCRKKAETKLECILLALAAFQQSDELEQTLNPVAAFGHALIELDAAFTAARNMERELTVESHLRHAEGWTSLARQSEFLRSTMDRTDLGSGFKLLELHGIVPGDDLIHLSRRFACALANYRRANWQDCVSEINDLKGVLDFPPPLQPYVEAALIDASLTEATADHFDSQFKALMHRLSSSVDADAEHSKYQLRRVALKHACEREDTLDDDSFAALVRATSDNAPNRSTHQEAIVLAAACRQGQRFPTEADLNPIVDSVEAMQDDEERHRFELLLAQYRMRQGRLDAALDLARRALPLPWTRPYVLKAPEFAEMISSPVYGPEFVKASFATATLSELESCPRLQSLE